MQTMGCTVSVQGGLLKKSELVSVSNKPDTPISGSKTFFPYTDSFHPKYSSARLEIALDPVQGCILGRCVCFVFFLIFFSVPKQTQIFQQFYVSPGYSCNKRAKLRKANMLLLARRQHPQTDWKSSVAWLWGAMGGNQRPLSPDPATGGISSPFFPLWF